MYRIFFSRAGFTFVELLVVLGVVSTLIMVSSVRLLTTQQRASETGVLTQVLSDIAAQQHKAMVGATGTEATAAAYGVRWETNQYILFRGSVYSASDPLNVTIPLDGSMQVSAVTFPNSAIVFSQGSGEIMGYNTDQDRVTFTYMPTGESHTLEFNRYGVVTSIN